MMITRMQVEHIAKLAKLQFSEAEKDRVATELTEILDYVEKLNELDTRDVEPMSHPTAVSNVMREDRVEPSLPAEVAVENAPSRQGTYFVVPKVIS